jgi:hypothetical protein
LYAYYLAVIAGLTRNPFDFSGMQITQKVICLFSGKSDLRKFALFA